MSDVGTEFTDFLKAYGLSDFYKLAKPSISDAEINAIFARHKANFDAWRKIPSQFKDAYGRAAPYMIEKAKNDPNFTESDAQKAREEHHKKTNPYSPLPDVLAKDPFFDSFPITPAHVAAWKCMKDNLMKQDYTLGNAEKLASQATKLKCQKEKINKITNDSNLSEKEKEDKIKELNQEQKNMATEYQKVAIEADKKDRPEQMIIRLLVSGTLGKTDKKTAKEEMDTYIQKAQGLGRLSALAKSLNDRFFEGISSELRDAFQERLQANGIDVHQFEQTRSDLSFARFGERTLHLIPTQNQQKDIRTSQIIQTQRNMRGRA